MSWKKKSRWNWRRIKPAIFHAGNFSSQPAVVHGAAGILTSALNSVA
jgi:hypothetical protein